MNDVHWPGRLDDLFHPPVHRVPRCFYPPKNASKGSGLRRLCPDSPSMIVTMPLKVGIDEGRAAETPAPANITSLPSRWASTTASGYSTSTNHMRR
jgi:hypothetical protein